MAAAQLDRDILNCIYFRTVNRVTVTPVILDLKYQIYSGRRCASVGRIYTQEQEQEHGVMLSDSLRNKTVMRQKHTHKNGYSSKTNKHVCQEVLPS